MIPQKPQNNPEQREYLRRLRSQSLIDNNWATLAYAYDALIVIALALNASIADLEESIPPTKLEWFNFSNAEMAQVLLRNAQATDVHGLTVCRLFTCIPLECVIKLIDIWDGER